MMHDDEESFRKAFNVRRIERCCGTCKHFDRQYEDSGCGHPRQLEFDSFAKSMSKDDPEYTETYGAYGGIFVDEGDVCDLWEKYEGSDR